MKKIWEKSNREIVQEKIKNKIMGEGKRELEHGSPDIGVQGQVKKSGKKEKKRKKEEKREGEKKKKERKVK